MYPICYRRVSGRYFQPEPAMYSRCFCRFPGPLAPSERFKSRYNVKNACVARNDPRGSYPSPESVFQAVKGLGCTLRSFNGLSLDDFISSGSVAARRRLKRLSLAPYYAAQMKRCTQKWDRRDDQGPNSETIDTCHQLVGIVGTGLYHSMADVQSVVGQTVDPILTSTD